MIIIFDSQSQNIRVLVWKSTNLVVESLARIGYRFWYYSQIWTQFWKFKGGAVSKRFPELLFWPHTSFNMELAVFRGNLFSRGLCRTHNVICFRVCFPSYVRSFEITLHILTRSVGIQNHTIQIISNRGLRTMIYVMYPFTWKHFSDVKDTFQYICISRSDLDLCPGLKAVSQDWFFSYVSQEFHNTTYGLVPSTLRAVRVVKLRWVFCQSEPSRAQPWACSQRETGVHSHLAFRAHSCSRPARPTRSLRRE